MKSINIYLTEAIINRDLTTEDILYTDFMSEGVIRQFLEKDRTSVDTEGILIELDDFSYIDEIPSFLGKLSTYDSREMFNQANRLINFILNKYGTITVIKLYFCTSTSLGMLIYSADHKQYVFDARYMPEKNVWRFNGIPHKEFNYIELINGTVKNK